MTMPHMPDVRFLVSSPMGDLPVDKERWHLPLEGDPAKTPYRTYFYSIKEFILQDDLGALLCAAARKLNRKIHPREVLQIIIRSEKHGPLYHPASIEIMLAGDRVKLCLNVAVCEEGKKKLRQEISVLEHLNKTFSLPYIPETYIWGEKASMLFLLEDWFQGYHEFHISRDETGGQSVQLWDFEKGCRLLSSGQSFQIYSHISRILTLYYDFENARQIYPWHHGAGDFVARARDEAGSRGGIDVRLTTVRGYGTRVCLEEKNLINSLKGLFHFFLNTTIRMRLDRLDGVKEAVWAGDVCLKATLKGFFDGLGTKEKLGHQAVAPQDFLALVKTFDREELGRGLSSILGEFLQEEELQLIRRNMPGHTAELHRAIQAFDL